MGVKSLGKCRISSVLYVVLRSAINAETIIATDVAVFALGCSCTNARRLNRRAHLFSPILMSAPVFKVERAPVTLAALLLRLALELLPAWLGENIAVSIAVSRVIAQIDVGQQLRMHRIES